MHFVKQLRMYMYGANHKHTHLRVTWLIGIFNILSIDWYLYSIYILTMTCVIAPMVAVMKYRILALCLFNSHSILQLNSIVFHYKMLLINVILMAIHHDAPDGNSNVMTSATCAKHIESILDNLKRLCFSTICCTHKCYWLQQVMLYLMQIPLS